MKRIAYLGIASLLLGLLALPAAAQSPAPTSQSGSSLGDYARQIRNDGGAQSKGKPKVFDNDNLPKTDKLSVIGDTTPPPEQGAQVAPAQNENEGKSAENQPAKDKAADANSGEAAKSASPVTSAASKKAADAKADSKQWADKLAAQKDQIDLLQREFDVTQREYQVRAAAMYGDVGNRLRNSAEWDKQDAQYKQQIADKQKAIEDAKQKLDDLQESARKAGATQ